MTLTSTTRTSGAGAPLKRPDHNYRRSAAIGLTIIGVTFGVFGIWAATAPLNSAVIAPGVVATLSNIQTVQHLEGGIVRKILVHDGDHVQAGQVLFELDPVQTEASLNITRSQLFSLLARRDRLEAERDNKPAVTFSPEVMAQSSDPTVAQAISDERSQFEQRRATLQSQVAILQARISEYQTEMQGLDTERKSMEQQVAYLNDEISGLQELYDKDLVPKPRLLAVKQQKAQLEGEIGKSLADKARTQKSIGETELQMRELQQQMFQDDSKELADVETQAADIRQRYIVAQDQARRINITAPMAGVAQNLRVFTDGAVIGPGAPLVDIAPDQGQMIVQAHVSPNDVDSVHSGEKAEVQFPAFHSRTTPVIIGQIESVSKDRIADPNNHTAYYMAIVNVPPANLPPQFRGRLRAGMPAQVMVTTGARSVLQYLWQPLSNALNKSMREQ
ncbi:MAG: HlyD family type I secretion periplasmic adaptor subunit [Alphaproteobacteria bacterium]|nr:HlyD family type I secretion periplasmic adaptor subunit [Alphaproteobacteria bacterium]